MTVAQLRTGIALAITVGVFYALCALVWALAPGPLVALMNNLFHGLDFSSMVRLRPLAWPGFIAALVVLSAWQSLRRWRWASVSVPNLKHTRRARRASGHHCKKKEPCHE